MAVFIKATYVKKLGLPQYSSHQYSVEVSAELTDLTHRGGCPRLFLGCPSAR